MKSGVISLLVFVIGLFSVSCFASAAIDLTINADFSTYNEDLIVQTVSGATTSFDYAYDAQIPTNQNPDGYAEFYSLVSGKKLAIDSWDESSIPRNLILGFQTSSPETSDLTLSWSFSSATYDLTLEYCEGDIACTSPSDLKNMSADSTLRVSADTANPVYFLLSVSEIVSANGNNVPPVDGVADGGGGGGGGGGAAGPAVYSLTESQLSSGVVESLKAKDKIVFSVSNQNHTLILNSFNNESADVTIQTTPKDYIIKLSETIFIDVNDDGTKDVSVSYVSYSASSARIEMKKLSAGFIADNIDKIAQDIGETVEKFRIDPVFRQKVLISVFSVLIILVVLVGILLKLLFSAKK